MADVLKLFSELANKTNPDDTDILAIESSLGIYYYVTRGNLLKAINLVSFTESEYDNGNVAAGTFTPNCDTNGNSHLVTLTGSGVTIEVPTKSLTGDQMIEGGLTIVGGDSNAIAGWGANWDFGDEGTPTLTSKSVIGFKRRAGDTKTIAWHKGGYA